VKTNYVPKKYTRVGPLVGGVGNQMFTLASAYGIAFSRNSSVCIQKEDFIAASRVPNAVTMLEKIPVCPPAVNDACVEAWEGGAHALYNPSIPANTAECVMPTMYLQSYKYFKNTNVPFVLRYLESSRKWLSRRRIDVCVHVRRSDMLGHPFLRQYNETQYLINAVKLMAKLKGSNLRYFVTSEDASWLLSQTLVPNAYINPFTTGESYPIDMSMLAACPNLIMTIGTFGWWGGYFNKGVVMYVPQPMSRQLFHDEDYFLSHWIPVNDTTEFYESIS
jgi:hypothetical protein